MINEAGSAGLILESHLEDRIKINPKSTVHNSRRSFYRIKKKFYRQIDHKKGKIIIHDSVKARWEQDKNYRPENLREYIDINGWN